jgi:hypothetical protein
MTDRCPSACRPPADRRTAERRRRPLSSPAARRLRIGAARDSLGEFVPPSASSVFIFQLPPTNGVRRPGARHVGNDTRTPLHWPPFHAILPDRAMTQPRTARDIRRTFIEFLRQEVRPCRRALELRRSARRPDAPLHQRGHEPVQGRLPRPRQAALHPRGRHAEVHIAPVASTTTSRRRQGHVSPHLLRDAGNWSFGDYFKKESIAWAGSCSPRCTALDPKRIYVTWFEGNESGGLAPDHEPATSGCSACRRSMCFPGT